VGLRYADGSGRWKLKIDGREVSSSSSLRTAEITPHMGVTFVPHAPADFGRSSGRLRDTLLVSVGLVWLVRSI